MSNDVLSMIFIALTGCSIGLIVWFSSKMDTDLGNPELNRHYLWCLVALCCFFVFGFLAIHYLPTEIPRMDYGTGHD